MAAQFESENFKEMKQKEKTDLFFLVFFIIMTYFSISQFTEIEWIKTKAAYAVENIKAYEAAIFWDIAAQPDFDSSKHPVTDIITSIQTFKSDIENKALSSSDLNNWKYIEFFINYHLAKVWQNWIKVGDPKTNFVNFSDQVMSISIITNNPKDINYLLDEFNKAGYLEWFDVSKDGTLYTANIKLHFLIN